MTNSIVDTLFGTALKALLGALAILYLLKFSLLILCRMSFFEVAFVFATFITLNITIFGFVQRIRR